MQQVEDVRVAAVTKENVAEHISRVQAAIKRYNIKSAKQIVNMDQSGISFKKMVGRSLRKGFRDNSKGNKSTVQNTLSAKGNLDRVTLMPVVAAHGSAFTPCVIYPGKQPHFRKVRGRFETLGDVLMKSHLYYNEHSAANSEIIYDWGKKFVEETQYIREDGKYMLLILDGYGAHIQYPFLKYMRDNRVVVIALPAHTSHVLQPLDVTVFNAYKSFLQEELHRAARIVTKLNAFTVAACISNAYCKAFISPYIQSGFVRCGLWNPESFSTDITALQHLFQDEEKISLDVLIQSFERRERSLLRDVNVEEEGRVRIDTKSGAHVTSDIVLDVLQEREQRKEAARRKDAEDSIVESKDVREGAAALRRYASLADDRFEKRKRLRESRGLRRQQRRARARLASDENH